MKKIVLAACLAALVGSYSVATPARDTDIYTRAKNVGRDDTPNVLIVVDTSGSMNTDVIITRTAYDPTVTYPTVGAIQAGRIYWDTKGGEPPTGTDQWFLETDNNCEASKSFLNTQGSYATRYAGAFDGNKWTNLTGRQNSRKVDCLEDDGATDTNGYATDTTTTGYSKDKATEIVWTRRSSPKFYTANYMNWRYGPTLTTTKTRMEIAKDVLSNIIRTNPNMRFGLMTFNSNDTGGPDGGRVVFSVDNMTPTRTTAMVKVVNSLVPKGYTPLAETMWEAYTYLAGKNVDFGDDDTSSLPARDTTAENGAGQYISPFKYECQQAYIIYMTDGDPTNDNDADTKIGALSGIGVKSSNSNSTTGYTDNSYLDELAKWMYSHDVITGATLSGGKGRRVSTYTIGFGSGISASGLQLLKDTATTGRPGIGYYTANDADQLTAAFQAALLDVLSVTTSFAAPALSVNAFNTLFNRDEVYFALFKAAGTACWPGNIKKYTLCTGLTTGCTLGEVLDKTGAAAIDPGTLRIKDAATSFWSTSADGNEATKGGAGANLPAPASRKIYTYTGGYAADGRTPTGTVALSNTANLLEDTNTNVTGSMLGVPTGTGTEAADRTAVINWIRGQDVRDEDLDGITTEQRDWYFADPLHSRPVAITYGGTDANPIVKLFVGTNDGGLRMINENTGQEEWMFVPKELLGKLYNLSLNPNGEHELGLDGTPRFRIRDRTSATNALPDGIIDPSIGDYVHVFISMRRGGRDIYALDVTPAAKVTGAAVVGEIQPKLLWVIQGGTTTGFEKLAETWSDPKVTAIRYGTAAGTNDSAAKTVLLFGGGYDTAQDSVRAFQADTLGNAIYIVDPATGERLGWISNTGSGANLELAGMDYSIPSELAIMDADGDGETDRIYVGDVSGQLWRIDLNAALTKTSTGASFGSGYRFADISCTAGTRADNCTGTPAQDRRKFFFPPDITQVYDSVYEDTAESKHDLITITTGDREDPLDFLTDPAEPVHNRIYVFRDYRTKTGPADATSDPYNPTITNSSLYDVTGNPFQSPTATAIADIKGAKGWYIDLKEADGTWKGQKGLAKTVIFGGTLFATTFTPANSTTALMTCAPNEGLAKLYVLNILNGSAMQDLDGDGTPDLTQGVGGGIPSELVTVIRPGGVSGLIGPYNPESALGGNKKDLPRAKTYWNQ